LEITRKTLEAKIDALREMLEDAKEEETQLNRQKEHIYNLVAASREQISKLRMADISPGFVKNKKKDLMHGKSKKTNKNEKR
jgi:hypothetical protein